jgi:hypothetical protein
MKSSMRIWLTVDQKTAKFRVLSKNRLIRFETVTQHCLLKRVFGSGFDVGVRKKKPKIGCKPETIGEADNLNVVEYIDAVTPPSDTKFIRVPGANHGGIDISYDNHGWLSIRARYKKEMKKDIDLASLISPFEPPSDEDPTTVAESADDIFVGDLFDFNSGVFKVLDIDTSNRKVSAENVATGVVTEFADWACVAKAIKKKLT